MGVISITQRSESLGNIRSSGTPRRANTDIGTVHRTSRPVYAPTFFAKHSHAGDAAIAEGLGRIGDAALKIGIAIQDREDERQADKISQAVMSNLDRMDRDDRDIDDWNAPDRKHLEGQKRGLLLRTGEGCKNLPQEADDSYGDTFKKIADSIGATDKQREMASERLYGYRRARQNRMMDLQSSEYRRIELDGAAGQLEQFVASWKNGNTGVLEDIFTAQERLGILKGKTEDTRKAERGNLAVVLASDLVRNKLNGCASDEDFDTLEKAVRKSPEEFMPVEIASRLPDGKLGGKAQDALVDEIRKERRMFKAEQKLIEHEAHEAARNAAREQEIKLHLLPVPQTDEAQAAHFEQMGAAYAEMAKNPNLDEATRLSYAKTAESLGFRAVGERAASAAARKAAEKEAIREARAQIKEAQEEMFSMAEADFTAGGYYTEQGGWQDMDANEMAERARTLLNEKKITRVQFNKLMTIQKPKMDEQNLAFRDLVLADVKKLLPNIGYRNGRFQFKPTKDVAITKSTGVGFETGKRWYWTNPRSEYTYGELIKAMNITLEWQQNHKATPVEAKKHFDELTKGIISGQQRANVQQALEESEQLNEDWRNAHGH